MGLLRRLGIGDHHLVAGCVGGDAPASECWQGTRSFWRCGLACWCDLRASEALGWFSEMRNFVLLLRRLVPVLWHQYREVARAGRLPEADHAQVPA